MDTTASEMGVRSTGSGRPRKAAVMMGLGGGVGVSLTLFALIRGWEHEDATRTLGPWLVWAVGLCLTALVAGSLQVVQTRVTRLERRSSATEGSLVATETRSAEPATSRSSTTWAVGSAALSISGRWRGRCSWRRKS